MLEEEGHVWERLLLTIDAPFLALSATIGDPDAMFSWLKRVDEQRLQQQRSGASATSAPPRAPISLVRFDDAEGVQPIPRYSFLRHSAYIPDGAMLHTLRGLQDTPDAADVNDGGGVDDGSESGDEDEDDEGAAGSASEPPSDGAAGAPIDAARAEGSAPGGAAAAATSAMGALALTDGAGALAAAAAAVVVEEEPLALTKQLSTTESAAAASLLDINAASLLLESHLALRGASAVPPAVVPRATSTAASALTLSSTPAPESFDATQLLPEHALALYETMTAAVGSAIVSPEAALRLRKFRETRLSQLSPEGSYLCAPNAPYKRPSLNRARAYGAALGGALYELYADPLTRSVALTVLDKLQHPLATEMSAVLELGISRLTALVPSLCAKLLEKGMLPAILFHLSRPGCRQIAGALFDDLRARQDTYTQTRKYATELATLQNKLSAAERAFAEAENSCTRARDNLSREQAESERSSAASDVASLRARLSRDVLPEFTLPGPSGLPTQTHLDELLSRYSGDSKLLAYLLRGIGVHHATLDKRYRAAVEVLFRRKLLGVIVATGTLAQGINMPCRTVVFAGDSIYLDRSSFLQMSGRAGRRGHDKIGNVVLVGFSVDRIRQLTLDPLRPLSPSYPLSTSHVLRMALRSRAITLVNDANDGEGAIVSSSSSKAAAAAAAAVTHVANISASWDRACDRLLQFSLHACFNKDAQEQILLHSRFSVELLRQQRLLNSECVPVDMAAIACYLHWAEPANLALVTLLQSGALARCGDDALLMVLSFMFCRDAVPPPLGSADGPALFLPPMQLRDLPPEVLRVLAEYNRSTLSLLMQYLSVFAAKTNAAHGGATAWRLPFSKLEFPGAPLDAPRAHTVSLPLTDGGASAGAEGSNSSSSSNGGGSGWIASELRARAVPFLVRSPFSALCCGGDAALCGDLQSICVSSCEGITLDSAQIPTWSSFDQHVPPLASVFWSSGSLKTVMNRVGVDVDDAYRSLLQLSRVLSSVAAGCAAAAQCRREGTSSSSCSSGEGEEERSVDADEGCLSEGFISSLTSLANAFKDKLGRRK